MINGVTSFSGEIKQLIITLDLFVRIEFFCNKVLRAGAEAIRLAIFIPSIKVLLSFSSARKFPFIAGWSSGFDDLICIDPLDSGLSWQGEIVIPG